MPLSTRAIWPQRTGDPAAMMNSCDARTNTRTNEGDVTMTARPHRVVIENADPASREAERRALRARGLDVVDCGGPRDLGVAGCPVVTSGRCSLVEHADVVLFDLDLDNEDDRAVLAAMRAAHPDVPVVLEVPTAKARRHAGVLAGLTVIPPYDAEHLAATVEAAASHPASVTDG